MKSSIENVIMVMVVLNKIKTKSDTYFQRIVTITNINVYNTQRQVFEGSSYDQTTIRWTS